MAEEAVLPLEMAKEDKPWRAADPLVLRPTTSTLQEETRPTAFWVAEIALLRTLDNMIFITETGKKPFKGSKTIAQKRHSDHPVRYSSNSKNSKHFYFYRLAGRRTHLQQGTQQESMRKSSGQPSTGLAFKTWFLIFLHKYNFPDDGSDVTLG